MNQPLPLDRIPHQPPMRWIQSATRTGETSAVCTALVPARCGAQAGGPILLGLEILAQAGAVLLASVSSAPSSEGRLLSVREARWKDEILPLDVSLRVEVELIQSSAIGLHQFSGQLFNPAGHPLLETEFSLLVGGPSA